MEKASVKRTAISILAILCCVYAVILFALTSRTMTMWIALVFCFAQSFVFGFAVFGRNNAGVEGLFRTYPKLIVPAICLVAQSVIGCVLAFVLPGDVTISSVIGIVLLAVSIVALLGIRNAMEYAGQIEEEQSVSIGLMKNLLLDLQDIQGDIPADSDIYADLETVIGQLRFSDVRSNVETESIDSELAESIERIKNAQSIEKRDLDKIRKLIESRNRRLKASK